MDRVCEAQRSNESPSGAFKRQRGLRQQMEGRCPDKRYPNKITWKTRKSLRSEVTDGQKIFKNKKFVGTGRFLHSTAALKTHFRELFPNC